MDNVQHNNLIMKGTPLLQTFTGPLRLRCLCFLSVPPDNRCYIPCNYFTISHLTRHKPCKSIQTLKLVFYLGDAGSNLCRGTDYPELGFSWLSSVHPHKFRNTILKESTTASFHTLSNRLLSLSSNHSILYN
jgi:hypothetical protein